MEELMRHNKAYLKRTLATALTALCIIGMTACGNGESGTKVVFTTGFGKDEVFRIEDAICKKSELMVYLVNTQNRYEEVYGDEVWKISQGEVTLEENVKETVLARIAQIKTMCLLAEEKGVELEEQEEEKARRATEEYYASLSRTEIQLLGVDQELIENMYRDYALAEKVYQYIIQDVNPEISDDEARTITVQHIFLRTWNWDEAGNKVPYSEAAKKTVLEEIGNIREMAVKGEYDFAELASKYSDDSNITYSFGKGDVEEAYETLAFQLETDEISKVLETDSGYYIIKCINTFNREETDANKLKIMEQRKQEVFDREYDDFVNNLANKLNEEVWEQVELLSDDEVDTSDFFEVYDKYFSGIEN